MKRKAAERVIEAEAAAVLERYSSNGDQPPALDFVTAVERVADRCTRLEAFLAARVEALDAAAWRDRHPQAAAEVALYLRALGELRKVLRDCGRLGLDERAFAMQVARETAIDRAADEYSTMIDAVVDGLAQLWGVEGDPLADEDVQEVVDRALARWQAG